ncbi:MAG: O-antigen ligase family protein [Candidatus Eisenbacteria bacterium]|nr:O-antigen ligase family protein [Candidatus Eisenbacteria bacterium]
METAHSDHGFHWTSIPLIGFAIGSFAGIAIAQTSLGLGLLGLILSPIFRRKWGGSPPRDIGPALGGLAPVLIFYFAVQIFAIVTSQHIYRSFTCLRGDLPVLILPLFVLLFLRSPRPWLPLWVFLGMAALSGLYGLWQFFSGMDLYHGEGLEALAAGTYIAIGNLGGHLTYGGVHLVATLLALGLALYGPPGRIRRWAWFLALASGAGLLTSAARTAWVGFLAGSSVLLWGLGRRRFLLGLAAMIVLAGLALLLPGVADRAQGFLQFSDLPRIRLWRTALKIWADFPIFGAGLGAYKTHFPLYKLPGGYMSTIHPHNDLLNIAVHSGIAGLVAFAWLWIRLWRGLKEGLAAPARVRGLAWGGLAVIVGFLVAGGGQCYFTDEEPVAALWFVLGMGITAVWSAKGYPQDAAQRKDGIDDEGLEALPPLDQGVASGTSQPSPTDRFRIPSRAGDRSG